MEDGLEPVREVVVEGRCGNRDHAEAQRGGDDDQVDVVLVADLGQGADTAGRHGAEQHDARATQYRSRDRGNHPAHDRQQAEHHQDHATGGHHVAALDPGHGYQADVLSERALGERAEDRRQDARCHVGAQAVAKALGVDLGVDDLTHGEDVGRGLHQGHHDHDAHRQDRGDVEFRHAEMERRGEGEHWAFSDLAEVSHAQRPGDQRADHHGQQDRQARDRRAAQFAQQQHDGEGQGRQADVGHAAEFRRGAVATHHPASGHGHQGQADGGDDDAGDQRREELGNAREHRGDQKADQRRCHDRPEHARQAAAALAAEDRTHGCHAGERNALHQRQLAAEERQAEGLQQGGQATGKQRSGDQHADFGTVQARGLPQDQGYRDDPPVHGQHMLQTIGQVGTKAEVFILGALGGRRARGRSHGAGSLFIVVVLL